MLSFQENCLWWGNPFGSTHPIWILSINSKDWVSPDPQMFEHRYQHKEADFLQRIPQREVLKGNVDLSWGRLWLCRGSLVFWEVLHFCIQSIPGQLAHSLREGPELPSIVTIFPMCVWSFLSSLGLVVIWFQRDFLLWPYRKEVLSRMGVDGISCFFFFLVVEILNLNGTSRYLSVISS